jgi:hypothetical protein
LAVAWLTACAPSEPASLTLVLDEEPASPSRGALLVRGLPAAASRVPPAAWAEVVELRTADAGRNPHLPAMLASHAWHDGTLVVTPRFPLEPGAPYRASFDGGACARLAGLATPLPSLEVELRVPAAAAGETPEVAAIYPSADEVPENLLRVYVWFSRPMRSRDVDRHVILLDEAGTPVELPFVEIAEGLWDPMGQRLTVFFHPGRLKRGVGPHRALGSPLRQGRRYRLEIASEMRDASGRRLARSFAKTFSMGPAVRRALDPAGWEIRPPAAADTASASIRVSRTSPATRSTSRSIATSPLPPTGVPAVKWSSASASHRSARQPVSRIPRVLPPNGGRLSATARYER